MFRKMRRIDREIDQDKSMKILEEGNYGIFSTISEDGYPYGVPISYALLDGNLYFHSAKKGHKLDNIENDNKISFCVVGQTEILPSEFATNYESVIIFGKATKIEGEEKIKVLMEIINKYSKDFKVEGKAYIEKDKNLTTIIKISIEHMSGKARMTD